MRRIFANSSFVRIGHLSSRRRQSAGCGLSRLPSEPSRVSAEVMSLLADAVDRRVGDLREELLEVVVEQPRLVRQHGERRVVAHRAHGLDAVACHRREHDALVLERVAERDLALQQRVGVRRRQLRARPAGRRAWIRYSSSHCRYGRCAEIVCLISSSSMMRPCSVSTRNMRPGCRRPFCTMFSGGRSSTPTSEAMITRSSFVT